MKKTKIQVVREWFERTLKADEILTLAFLIHKAQVIEKLLFCILEKWLLQHNEHFFPS